MKKIPFPIDKREWAPSLMPGPIVLISTFDEDKNPNVAPKSWVSMVSFDPPILMFSGSKGNTTENNVLRTGCFAINLVDSSLAKTVFECLQWHGRERIEKCGFTLSPADKIDAPLIGQCRAHLECRLIDTREIGSGFVIFGEIVAASIWDEIMKAEPQKRYALLDQTMFLEDGVFAALDGVRIVE
jgi:flavin reductase (DIM6/NTAB) family NADH-FMN oxidoreductase RutF